MLNRRLKLVFLDLNGTIVDDWDVSHVAVAAIFKHYGKPCPSLEEYVAAVATSGDYHRFYLSHGIQATREELYAIYSPAYYAHRQEAVVIPGACDFAEWLTETGVEVHLLTAARRDFAEPLVDAAGIGPYCAAFHYHVHNKAEQMLAVIDGASTRPQECLMIGDLPSDVMAAKSVGAHAALIVNRHVPETVLSEAKQVGCIATAFDFIALRQCLTMIFQNTR